MFKMNLVIFRAETGTLGTSIFRHQTWGRQLLQKLGGRQIIFIFVIGSFKKSGVITDVSVSLSDLYLFEHMTS